MGIACTEPALDPSAKSQSCTESRKIPRQEQELWIGCEGGEGRLGRLRSNQSVCVQVVLKCA